MKQKKQIYYILFSLFFLLITIKIGFAQEARSTEFFTDRTMMFSPLVPEWDRFVWRSVFTIAPEGRIRAALGIFDDPATNRPVDYVELYDDTGSLLAVGWVDRFGILRTAMDRGLLQEDTSRLEGILVLVLEGTPL